MTITMVLLLFISELITKKQERKSVFPIPASISERELQCLRPAFRSSEPHPGGTLLVRGDKRPLSPCRDWPIQGFSPRVFSLPLPVHTLLRHLL